MLAPPPPPGSWRPPWGNPGSTAAEVHPLTPLPPYPPILGPTTPYLPTPWTSITPIPNPPPMGPHHSCTLYLPTPGSLLPLHPLTHPSIVTPSTPWALPTLGTVLCIVLVTIEWAVSPSLIEFHSIGNYKSCAKNLNLFGRVITPVLSSNVLLICW